MDIKCVVCGEPWDSWGTNHGDMTAWQYRLFQKGAGCPCCEGVPKDGKRFEISSMDDLENGDGDAMERIVAYSKAGKVSWEEPPFEVVAECARCEVQLLWDNQRPMNGSKPSEDPIFLCLSGGKPLHYYEGRGPYSYSSLCPVDDEDPPVFVKYPKKKKGEKTYCPGCLEYAKTEAAEERRGM